MVWQYLLSIQVISDLDGKFLTSSLEMTRLVHLQTSYCKPFLGELLVLLLCVGATAQGRIHLVTVRRQIHRAS